MNRGDKGEIRGFNVSDHENDERTQKGQLVCNEK